MPEVWFDPARTFAAGEHRETDWFRLPTQTALWLNADGSPARVAERQGSLVGFSFPVWQDGVSDHWALPGFGDIGKMSFTKNGVQIGTSTRPSGQIDVGNEPSELGVQLTQFRSSRPQAWELALGTLTRFTFRTSRPEGDAVQPLPIALPRYDAPVDGRNLAPAAAGFPVSVTMNGQQDYDPGAITGFTAKVSFEKVDLVDFAQDDPAQSLAWTDVPVVQQDGDWVALVDNSAAAGKVASLWITATDSHGTKTEQFTFNLYGVK
jgi:hypothetical protein